MKRILFLTGMMAAALVAAAAGIPDEKLKVGVAELPPFVIISGQRYSGVSVDLWRNITDSLKMDYQYIRFPNYPELHNALKKGEIDISVYPLSVSSERLSDFRFSIPFYISKLGLAEKISYRNDLFRLLGSILSWTTLRWFLLLLPVTLLFSVLVWLFEKKNNSAHFRPGYKGIGDGLWWAFVTMSTVGYGDKAPKSTVGRILTILWIFFAVTMFVSVTGFMSSEMTVSRIRSFAVSKDDLKKVMVGTIANSGYSRLLESSQIRFKSYGSIEEGYKALMDQEVDFFIYDGTIMKYMIREAGLGKKIKVIETPFENQYFCFPAPYENEKLIDAINPVLINIIESNLLHRILREYQMAP